MKQSFERKLPDWVWLATVLVFIIGCSLVALASRSESTSFSRIAIDYCCDEDPTIEYLDYLPPAAFETHIARTAKTPSAGTKIAIVQERKTANVEYATKYAEEKIETVTASPDRTAIAIKYYNNLATVYAQVTATALEDNKDAARSATPTVIEAETP